MSTEPPRFQAFPRPRGSEIPSLAIRVGPRPRVGSRDGKFQCDDTLCASNLVRNPMGTHRRLTAAAPLKDTSESPPLNGTIPSTTEL
jgi:hypothetical protein